MSGLSISTVIAPVLLIQRAFDLLYGVSESDVAKDFLCGGQPEGYGLPSDCEDQVDRMGDEALNEALDGAHGPNFDLKSAKPMYLYSVAMVLASGR